MTRQQADLSRSSTAIATSLPHYPKSIQQVQGWWRQPRSLKTRNSSVDKSTI